MPPIFRMAKIISPCLNSTYIEIKLEALRLLGAAVQSNPKVQLKALESDFVQKLLHPIAVNSKTEIRARCLFALGALVRNFPASQKAFIDHGGLELFGKILDDGPTQIQVRVMNIVNDLNAERRLLKEIVDKEQRDKITKEYDATDFDRKLLSQYCRHLGSLLAKSAKGSRVDEFLEVLYESVIEVAFTCKKEFLTRSEEILPVVETMLEIYRSDEKESSDDEKASNAHLAHLLEKLRRIVLVSNHDEL